MQKQDPAWTGDSAHDCLTIAVVRGKKYPQATIMKRSWRELVCWLSRHQERQEKDGPGWLPVIFRNRAARRANKNVAAVTLLVLDMDDGTPLQVYRERLAPFDWCAYTTHSHTAAQPRYRVVIRLTRPIPVEQWPAFYRRAVQYFMEGRADASCKDSSRFYYLPACRPGAERWDVQNVGAPLDPEAPPWPPSAEPGAHPQADGGPARDSAGAAHGRIDGRELVGRLKTVGLCVGRDPEETDKHYVHCPWEHEHSDPRPGPGGAHDRDTFFRDGSGCYPALFHCSHAHSQGPHGGRSYTLDDVQAWLRQKDGSATDPGTNDRPEEDGVNTKGRGSPGSHACRLLQLVRAAGVELFHHRDEAYATLPVGDHRETWRVKSRPFERHLRRLFHRADPAGVAPGSAIKDAVETLEALAFEGPDLPVSVRLAEHEGAIYLDLANDEWQVVAITPEGWKIVQDSPVRFCRTKGMKPLPCPVRGGSIEELRPFVHVGSEEDWRLLVAWLLVALRARGPYPVLNLSGGQDSAKSTTARVLRALIDPNMTDLRSLPKDLRDLMIGAQNNAVVACDNLSRLPAWLSDALCRLANGAALATRSLYTDDEEALFTAIRPVILNGIGEVVTRSDLLDRALRLDLPALDDAHRRPEAEFWAEFEQARPRILGALLDAVVVGLRNLPTTRLALLPRMADFAKWVTAAEPGLGWPPGAFMEAYRGNRAEAHLLALEASPVGELVVRFVEEQGRWKGTTRDLLRLLAAQAGRAVEGRDWPRCPRSLSTALQRIAPNLKAVGVRYEPPRKTHGKRILLLERVAQDPAAGE